MNECKNKYKARTQFDPNEIVIKHDIAEIILYDKKCEEKARAIIDIEDIGKAKKYKWCLCKGYVVSNPNGFIYLHHIIGGMPGPGKFSDHKDGNPLNNRKSNIRDSTRQQNAMNRGKQKNNTSGYKGVCYDKKIKKWKAGIKKNQKRIHIGVYLEKEDAAEAYNEVALKLFGEFACLNKI